MNVCFFNRSYWPDQAATGQLLTELADDLVSRHGCAVTVVAGRPLRSGAAGRAGAAREVRNGVLVRRAAGTTLSTATFAGRAANYLTYAAAATAASLRIGRPDVIVSLTDPPVIGLTALWAARRTGARFVYVCEDVFPDVASALDGFHSGAINAVLDRINRRLLREADAIVALGERMRRRLVEEKGADPARVHVIHNWADTELIRPASKDNPLSRELGLADRFVVMHSGNVGHAQDFDALLAAAERLRSREGLIVAIAGSGARRERLERVAVERRLSNVRFLPYQPKERLSESFGAADVFVVSLRAGLEGYIVPSKVYGILAAGRPYVAATDPSCEAAVLTREHQCGLVAAPGDPEALASAIVRLHDDPAAARAMGAAARRASSLFDRRGAVQAYYDLLCRTAGPRSAA
jgi:glycosyltransferase involved in cell wall biosynthesis